MSKVMIVVIALALGLASARNFHLQNNCPYGINAKANTNWGRNPLDGMWLESGQSGDVNVDDGWSGRFFANDYPCTLTEFQLNGWNNLDFYEGSVIFGFSMPMQIIPSNGCDVVTCWGAPSDTCYNTDADKQDTHGCAVGDFTIVYCP